MHYNLQVFKKFKIFGELLFFLIGKSQSDFELNFNKSHIDFELNFNESQNAYVNFIICLML
jgi:hypothetical protein